MDKTYLVSALTIGLSISSFYSSANDVIYRWVDKNNIVHFSQHQPEHDNYTTLNISGNSKNQVPQAVANNTKTEPTDSVSKDIAAIKKEDEKTAVEETMSQRCEEARTNVRTLLAFDKVQYTDAKGKAKVLSETEKNQQLTLSEKQIEVYCSK